MINAAIMTVIDRRGSQESFYDFVKFAFCVHNPMGSSKLLLLNPTVLESV